MAIFTALTAFIFLAALTAGLIVASTNSSDPSVSAVVVAHATKFNITQDITLTPTVLATVVRVRDAHGIINGIAWG